MNIVTALSITGTSTFMFGLCVGIVGICCVIFVIKKKLRFFVKTNKSQYKNNPVYEDVDPELKVQVSPNVAYEDVHKTFQSQTLHTITNK